MEQEMVLVPALVVFVQSIHRITVPGPQMLIAFASLVILVEIANMARFATTRLNVLVKVNAVFLDYPTVHLWNHVFVIMDISAIPAL